MMKKSENNRRYHLNTDGAFIIEDYSQSKAFSNFFPGVAGEWGIPMWVFYVNRGQGISSFGIESKDRAILEFQPANKAYRLTSTQGFRTFIKINQGNKEKFYEPFGNQESLSSSVSRRMIITSYDLTIEEIHKSLGIKTRVNYFTMPHEPFASLVRRLTIENISSKPQNIQIIDGLPLILPYGMKDWLSKNMCRTVEAWVKVKNVNKKAPYYQLNVEVADTPQVTHINEGNFYFCFDAAKNNLFQPIIDPSIVFGQSTDFLVPEQFLVPGNFQIPSEQFSSNRTPAALSYGQFTLKPKTSKELISLIGFAHDIGQLNRIVTKVTKNSFINKKMEENRLLIEEIKQMCFTHSSSTEFNHYCGQTFLDNVLRGGLPISLPTASGPVAFNVYSRKHGDPERDYNFFTLAPTFLSQGNGNFRDVNQNRRNDVWFNGDVKDTAVVNFFSLQQADGYNPLVVKGLMFSIHDESIVDQLLERYVQGENHEKLRELIRKGFMPGDLFKVLYQLNLKLSCSPVEFVTEVLGCCQKQELADHGEGFWSDHWTYNIDLLESYLSVYPERLKEILFDKKVFGFYFNNHYVLPRDQRYVHTKHGVRQYHSVVEREGETHAKQKGFKLRTKNGQGEVYLTTLIVKMLCLIANKAATIDPSGIGIEMEAEKPNWYDALNGLPGLLGSAISETFELKRYAQFVLEASVQLNCVDDHSVDVFAELAEFIRKLTLVLVEANDPLDYWKRSNEAKENYRTHVRLGVVGEEQKIYWHEIKKFLNLVVAKTNQAMEIARNGKETFATYFYHEVTDYENLDSKHPDGTQRVRPLAFKRHDLPLFLEGFVHALRVGGSSNAKKIYQAVKKSKLYDRKLGMYKVNADLSSQTEEIGRTRIFPSGWLENESIWLHMEYKYFLEILRTGLADEFFTEASQAMIPFLNPDRYGRSILENSSFIVSSAHEDESLHGQGFVARLSGSTAEFLHMWLVMNLGLKPFRISTNQEVTLNFEPILPSYFFTQEPEEIPYFIKGKKWETIIFPANTYAFNLMGRTLVVYHNPSRKNTYGSHKAEVSRLEVRYVNKSTPLIIQGASVNEAVVQDIRQDKIERIDVYLY